MAGLLVHLFVNSLFSIMMTPICKSTSSGQELRCAHIPAGPITCGFVKGYLIGVLFAFCYQQKMSNLFLRLIGHVYAFVCLFKVVVI